MASAPLGPALTSSHLAVLQSRAPVPAAPQKTVAALPTARDMPQQPSAGGRGRIIDISV